MRSENRPVVLLDAGNALFRSASEVGSADAEKKARVIAEAMGALGYGAMAVGPRDLVGGVDFLRKVASSADLPLVSANLVDDKGKLLFAASRVVSAGGVKVGVIGVSPEGRFQTAPGVQGEPPLAAAIKEARRLRKSVDLIVVLAALPYERARELLEKAPEGIDFVVQASDGRTSPVQRHGAGHLFSAGDRGRSLAKLSVDVAHKGPLVDGAESDRLRERLRLLEKNEQELARRIAATKDAAARKSLEDVAENFRVQRRALEQAGGKPARDARAFKLSWVGLGADVPSDPALEKQVAPWATAAH